MKVIFFFLVRKQTSSHNNFGMSERFEKLFYFLSSAPFYYIVLKNRVWNVDSDTQNCYKGLNTIFGLKNMGKKMENYLEQLKR